MDNSYSNDLDLLVKAYGGEFVGSIFKSNPEIMLVLLEELIEMLRSSGINSQTQFFRDPVVLHTFENIVLPNYPFNQVIHIASVGCSYGKEPYSLLLKNLSRIFIEAISSVEVIIKKSVNF